MKNTVVLRIIVLLTTSVVLPFMAANTLCAQSAYDQAMELYQKTEYDKALMAVEIDIAAKATPEMLMLRADCKHKLGSFTEALDDYDRCKILGYSKDDVYLHRGIVKVSLALYESAKIDLTNYIQRHEDDARGYYWLATIEYMMMEHKASLRYLSEALWLDSTYADAYYLRAANYADQNKMNLAFEDFQSAFALKPTEHRSKLNMAIIMLDMGQFKNAAELLSELRLENIDFKSDVLYYRGEALYHLHDMEGACGDWVEAANLGDPDAESNYRRLCIDKKDKPRFKRRQYVQF
jgi:tetratricopeptide (TPR) repeat protein